MIVSLRVCKARYALSTQNNKLSISLQYPKKEVNDEGDFLLAGKRERFLQIDTSILMEMFKYCQSSQNSKFAIPLQHLEKEVRDETDFLHADKHQSFRTI